MCILKSRRRNQRPKNSISILSFNNYSHLYASKFLRWGMTLLSCAGSIQSHTEYMISLLRLYLLSEGFR